MVIPSLPGYGFSGPVRERGWNIERTVRAFAELMLRLGYPRYGAQGGDWGAMITTRLAELDEPHVVGLLGWIVEKFRTWSDCGGAWSRCFPATT